MVTLSHIKLSSVENMCDVSTEDSTDQDANRMSMAHVEKSKFLKNLFRPRPGSSIDGSGEVLFSVPSDSPRGLRHGDRVIYNAFVAKTLLSEEFRRT
eukprot:3936194-Rhodomonas_salina.1